MKNITVSIHDDLYHRARVRAAEKQSTVTALVRDFLIRLVADDSSFERRRQEQNEAVARIRTNASGFSASTRLERSQVHERHAIR